MENANDILKIRYTVYPFDFVAMRAHTRCVYELQPDGHITYLQFENGISKPIEKKTTHSATLADYETLCTELNACISTADRIEGYDDNTGAEVKITRSLHRIETMDRGYGNGSADVGQIICRYIYGVGGMKW